MNPSTRKLIIGAVIIAVLLAAIVIVIRSNGRRQLEALKKELIANGEILSLADLEKKYPNTEHTNNSAGALASALIYVPTTPIAPSSFGWMELTAPGRANVQWRNAELRLPFAFSQTRVNGKLVMNTVHSTNTWGDLHQQMQAGEPALTKIRALLQQPDRDLGWYYTNVLSTPARNYVHKRIAAQILAAATADRMHSKELPAALENLEALANLTRMHDRDWTLVSEMIRTAIANLGESVTWDALQSPDWSDEQLARLQAAWQRVDLISGLQPVAEVERATMLNVLEELARPDGKYTRQQILGGTAGTQTPARFMENYVISPFWRTTLASQDAQFLLENFQPAIVAARSISKDKSWLKVKPPLEESAARQNQEEGITPRRLLVSNVMLANFSRAFESVLRTETMRQMLLADIALKRYHLRHGKYPADLNALAPQYLPSPPVDFMVGRPLQYHLEADGDFTLYSVGADGRDDHGDAYASVPDKKLNTIWDGRDAVWPHAVVEVKPASREELAEVTAVELNAVPLKEAINVLVIQAGLSVTYDADADKKINKTRRGQYPVSLNYTNTTAEAMLTALLANHGMEWVRSNATNRALIRFK